MAVEELLAPCLKASLLKQQVVLKSTGLLHPFFKLLFQRDLDLRSKLGAERDGPIVIDDLVLNERDVDCSVRAVGSLLVTATADEVFVDAAVSIDCVMHDQSTAAVAAKHAALQVVMVVADLFPDNM